MVRLLLWKSRSRLRREALAKQVHARYEEVKAKRDEQARLLVREQANHERTKLRATEATAERDALDAAMLEAGYVSIRKLREYTHGTTYFHEPKSFINATIEMYLMDDWSMVFFRKLNNR